MGDGWTMTSFHIHQPPHLSIYQQYEWTSSDTTPPTSNVKNVSCPVDINTLLFVIQIQLSSAAFCWPWRDILLPYTNVGVGVDF